MRFLLYSHDGMGLGHTRRHLAIATALTELSPNISVMLATGADEVHRLGLAPQVEVLKLPALRKLANDVYASRRLRIPAADIRALRAALLTATVRSFKPDVVLVDKHPFGADGEFREALQVQRQLGGATALGLRDILDDAKTVRAEWAPHNLQERIADHYDQVLVYGQRGVFDLVQDYGFSERIAARTRYCGYIVNRPDPDSVDDLRLHSLKQDQSELPLVLATAGGGEDGYLLLESFIRASVNAPWRGIVIAGPMIPDAEFHVLRRLAEAAKVTLHQFVPNLSTWFWSVNALVCMGGYNTLAEALCTGVPIVCVPRTNPRKEQLIRATAFAKNNLLRCVHPDQISADSMRDAVMGALGDSRQDLIVRASDALNFDGARQAASHLLALAAERDQPRHVAHVTAV
jgi:predicted glycosyltransferase